MSVRNEDQKFPDMLRDFEERLRKLESSQNNSVKRNDIRLNDLVVTADVQNMRLCLENLNNHQVVCLAEQELDTPTQAMWSFSGPLVGAENTLSPPYDVERECTARQIVVRRNYNEAFTGTIQICVHFNNESVIMLTSLAAPAEYSVLEINVPLVENDDIYCELHTVGTNAENISVFVRFGDPTVALSVTDCVF